jgi:ABC-type molybdate transport system substrate-binding protein
VLRLRHPGRNFTLIVHVLSAGAPKLGIGSCVDAYTGESGRAVEVEFATGKVIRARVTAGEAHADLVVAPVETLAEFARHGHTQGPTTTLGSVRTAMVVPAGAAAPDLTKTEDLRAALLRADEVVINEASSGAHVTRGLETLGLAPALADRMVRVANGAAVMERVAGGVPGRIVGFGQLTEIQRQAHLGVRPGGALPPELARLTTYGAALLAGGALRSPAWELLGFLGQARAAALLAAAGLEPASPDSDG